MRKTRGSRRGLVATAAAAVFILSGAGLIGVSLASQREAPQPFTDGSRVAAVGMMDAAALWLHSTYISPRQKDPSKVIGPILARSKPVSLDIPSINVHSDMQYLGLTPQDELQVPAAPRYNDAAWYRYSPTPGSLGPAIVLGHVDSASGGPSVFFRLGDLRRGDRVSITRADDSIAVFIVDEVHTYAKDDFPTDVVYRDINHAGLRLITCGGAFDDSTGHYLDNVVVFASLTG
jgi:hypothetical protein